MPLTADARKKLILRAVVREYIRTSEPVGSEAILDAYDFGVSSATIRNDMAALEERGFLAQPYTSAGRQPTVLGYRFYVDEFVHPDYTSLADDDPFAAALKEARCDEDHTLKMLARALAQATGETVVVRVGDEAFVTGVSNLSRKPEYREGALMDQMLRLVDELDERVRDIERRLTRDYVVLIGAENPFGEVFSSVMTRCESPASGEAVIGILGPQRMDYDTNVSLIRYLHEVFR